MRSKDTSSGRRILAKVEVPLSVEDITAHALRHLDSIGDNDPRETILSSNKRQIFNMAKSAIYSWGHEDSKRYIMQKHNGDFKIYLKIVKHKFPECD
jgi:hypothetical protein